MKIKLANMMNITEWSTYERPLNTIDFESPAHPGALLSGLNNLRSKGDLLDVTLLAEGKSFQAHRVVLASCSDYFRAMFTDAMRESRQSQICLNGVTAEGIRLLLNYAYTSRLALNLANIQDVLSAASHIQVVAVVEACSNYLQSQLDLENCVDIATIAETYSLTQLRRRVYRFISGRLQEFSMSNEFQRLSPQQLEYLLACEFPVDCPEEEVLRIVLKWLDNSEVCGMAHRLSYASRLLRKIHFCEIPSWKLDSRLQKVFIDQQSKEKQGIYRVIMREMYRQTFLQSKSLNSVFKKKYSNDLVNSRGMELAIIKVGGFSIGGITNEITYCLSNKKWRHLTSIPHVEQCNFGTAVLDNELYVIGGSFNQSLQENIHPFGFRYSPRYNKWTTIAPMQRERCRFSLSVLSGRLYAIGGSSELEEFVDGADQEEISACECYDPATDSWSSISPLPEGRSQHAGVTWPRNNNEHYIFISGGLERDLISDTVRRYDPSTDTWESRAPMLTPRADHVMLAINNKIYVCGGWFEDTDIGSRILVNTIDAYDLSSDTWEVVTRVPTPRYHAGIVEVDGKIYFIGGFHSDAMFDRDTAAIECYDVENDFWTTEEKYPQDVWEHTCVTLYIPKCRDDMEVMATNDNRR